MNSVILDFTLLLFSLPAMSDYPSDYLIKDYEEIRSAEKKDNKSNDQLDIHLNGLGKAYAWSNVYLDAEKKSPMFCTPKHNPLTPDKYRQILDDWIIENESLIDLNRDFFSMDLHLLEGLIKTFPCK